MEQTSFSAGSPALSKWLGWTSEQTPEEFVAATNVKIHKLNDKIARTETIGKIANFIFLEAAVLSLAGGISTAAIIGCVTFLTLAVISYAIKMREGKKLSVESKRIQEDLGRVCPNPHNRAIDHETSLSKKIASLSDEHRKQIETYLNITKDESDLIFNTFSWAVTPPITGGSITSTDGRLAPLKILSFSGLGHQWLELLLDTYLSSAKNFSPSKKEEICQVIGQMFHHPSPSDAQKCAEQDRNRPELREPSYPEEAIFYYSPSLGNITVRQGEKVYNFSENDLQEFQEYLSSLPQENRPDGALRSSDEKTVNS